MTAATPGCPGPLSWHAAPAPQGPPDGLLECQTCGYVTVAAHTRDPAHANTPVRRVPPNTVPPALITVSMPYWRCPQTVRRAVDAVLGQTFPALRLFVVNDGDTTTPPWAALADITDPRLVRVDLPVNRGRYYCDALVLAGCDTPWFAIHDADDHAEPDWLATLHTACEDQGWDAAFAPQTIHTLDGDTHREEVWLAAAGHASQRMGHVAHHAAVYRTAALRAVGGPHPNYRIGYDTLLVNLVALCGPVGAVDRPLYHRVARAGSLTRNPTTGSRSLARRKVRARLEQLYQLARTTNPATLITQDTPAAVAAQLAADVAALESGALAPGDRPAGGAATEPVWGGWALDQHTAHELAATLAARTPKVVVECGSGASTLLLGEYARAHGAVAVALEHHPTHHAATAAALATRGLTGVVDLRLAPLQPHPTPRGHRPFYATPLPAGIDFALIDGPPGTIGRAGTLYALMPHLTGDWLVWLDDADRPAEQGALAVWRGDLGVHTRHIPLPKGLAVITPAAAPPLRVAADDVAVTVLTGHRPGLLADTIGALEVAAPGLLGTAHVSVLHNGSASDPATAALLDGWEWIDQRLTYHEAPLLPHGPATALLAKLAAASGRPFWLHLEDDWIAGTTVAGWLDTARAALDADPQVGQVRLRHRGERVLDRHMVSGAPITWRQATAGVLTGRAHYTLNPALMRTRDAAQVWPAADEADAQRRYHAAGWTVAQADPGVFRHGGGAHSLHPGRRWTQ